MHPDAEKLHDLDIQASLAEETDKALALSLWRQGRTIAESLFSIPPAERCYLSGYFCYMLWSRTGEGPEGVESNFRTCLSLDLEHRFAQYYLGAFYFEAKRYDDAREVLGVLRATSEGFFTKHGQAWRYAKCLEMLTCVELLKPRLQNACELSNEMERAYWRLEEPESAMPTTLFATLDMIVRDGKAVAITDIIFLAALRISGLTRTTKFVETQFSDLAAELRRRGLI